MVLIPFYWKHFSELIKLFKEHGRKSAVFIGFSEFAGLFGYFLLLMAFSLGPVTLVNALSSVQPFFVLFLTVLISIFYPGILFEDTKKTTILLKLFAILLMFAGVMLVTRNQQGKS